MSWYAFLKEREYFDYKNYMYKSAVIGYLQTIAYHLESSSFQEVHLRVQLTSTFWKRMCAAIEFSFSGRNPELDWGI